VSGGGHGSGGKRRGHEEEHEEHENHERWLVSYADMMTLLMVLFIVLFAISQVDQKKFNALKSGLSQGLGAPVEILTGGDTLQSGSSGMVAPDVENGSTNAGTAASRAQVDKAVKAQAKAQAQSQVNNLAKAQKQLQAALKKAGVSKGATFRYDERGLVVSIATDNVLFKNGSVALEKQGQTILNALAPTLKALPNQLSIDGHTNSVPIHTAQFPTNWELSAERATGVLRYLHARDGIPFGRMSATAFADTEPRAAASNPKALSVNRRVEIVVLADQANTTGQAISQLGNATEK
jgi:chemotaxis protein MotB